MLLAIDIGNTNILIGGIRDDQIVFKARIATDRTRTSDQYGVEIKNMIEALGQKISDISDCIIASVVPPVFNSVRTGVMKILGKRLRWKKSAILRANERTMQSACKSIIRLIVPIY